MLIIPVGAPFYIKIKMIMILKQVFMKAFMPKFLVFIICLASLFLVNQYLFRFGSLAEIISFSLIFTVFVFLIKFLKKS